MMAYTIFLLGAIAIAGMLAWTGYAGNPIACDEVVGEVVTIRETGIDSYGNYRMIFTVRYEINDQSLAETFDMDADQFYANPFAVGDRLEMQVVQFNRFPPKACLGSCNYRICREGE
jgi:hypothetical protein